MNPVEILKNFGVNETLFIQFGIFFIAYLAMDFIVFRPYFRAYNERIRRTLGSKEQTLDILKQVEQKEKEYKVLARKLNGVINSIFNESNTKAKKDMEAILSKAKKESELQGGELAKQMELSIAEAHKDIEKHIPGLSGEIQRKLMERWEKWKK